MPRLFLALSISFLILWETPLFAVGLSTYNFFEDLKTFSSENEIQIVVNFAKPIKEIQKPQFFEKTIQFVFDKTYMVAGNKDFDVREELITGINVNQYNPNLIRLRLDLGKRGAWFEDKLTYEIKGNRLLINISKKGEGPSNYSYTPKTSFSAVEEEGLYDKHAELFSKTREQDGLSLDKFYEAKNNIDSGGAVPGLFSSSLRFVAALLIVLSFMLIMYYFVKKYLMKGGSFLGMEKQVKVISTNYFAPKKSITLVDIAGEVLVLGVTATNITLLSKIRNKEVLERIKNKKEKPFAKPSISRFSFNFNNKKTNRKENKPTSSAFSKQLEKYTTKAEETEKEGSSIVALNHLIQKKLDKFKTV